MKKLLIFVMIIGLILSGIPSALALTQKPGSANFSYILISDHITGEVLFKDFDTNPELINVSEVFIRPGTRTDIYIAYIPNITIDHLLLRIGVGEDPPIIKDDVEIDSNLKTIEMLKDGTTSYVYYDYMIPECDYFKVFAYAKKEFNPLYPGDNDKIETLGAANTRPIRCKEDLRAPIGHTISISNITSNSATALFMVDDAGNSGDTYSWINIYENKSLLDEVFDKRIVTWRTGQELTSIIDNLKPNTKYIFELVLANNAGKESYSFLEFTTQKILPTIKTLESFDYSYTDIGTEKSYIILKGMIDLANDHKTAKVGFYAIDRNIHEEYTRFEIDGISDISDSKVFELRIPIYRESTYMWKFYIIVDNVEIIADNEEYIFIQSKNKPKIVLDNTITKKGYVDIYGTVIDDGIPGSKITPCVRWGEYVKTEGTGVSWNGYDNDKKEFIKDVFVTYAKKSYSKGEQFVIRITEEDGLLADKGIHNYNDLSIQQKNLVGLRNTNGYRFRIEASNSYGDCVSKWSTFDTWKTEKDSVVELEIIESQNAFTKGNVEEIRVSIPFTGFTNYISVGLEISEIKKNGKSKTFVIAEGGISEVFSLIEPNEKIKVFIPLERDQFFGTEAYFKVPLSVFSDFGKYRIQAFCINEKQKREGAKSSSQEEIIEIPKQKKGEPPFVKLDLIESSITSEGVKVRATVIKYGQASNIRIKFCLWYENMPWSARIKGLDGYPVLEEWFVNIDEDGVMASKEMEITKLKSGKLFAVFLIVESDLGYQYISPAELFRTIPTENDIARPDFTNTKPHSVSSTKVEFSIIPDNMRYKKMEVYITCRIADKSIPFYRKIYGNVPADVIETKKSNSQFITSKDEGQKIYLYIDGLVPGMEYNYKICAISESKNEFGRMNLTDTRLEYKFRTKMVVPSIKEPEIIKIKPDRVLIDIEFKELGSTNYAEYMVLYKKVGTDVIYQTQWIPAHSWNSHQSIELSDNIEPDTRYSFLVLIRNGSVILGTQDFKHYKEITPYDWIQFKTPKE